jgi:hypothetical protein
LAHRVGICSSCRARYQIPATFPHDRARCRSCGGVVEIGPLEGEVAAKETAVAPAPAAAPVIEADALRASAPLAPAAPPAPLERPPQTAPAPRRSPLVPVLVGGLILAALALAAWRLLA